MYLTNSLKMAMILCIKTDKIEITNVFGYQNCTHYLFSTGLIKDQESTYHVSLPNITQMMLLNKITIINNNMLL